MLKLGRKLPKVWRPALTLDRYLDDDSSIGIEGLDKAIYAARYTKFPTPARPIAERWEHQSIHLLHDPAGNDTVGDCTCAGIVKLDVAWSRNAGQAYAPDMTPLALGLYEKATGYNPSDPSTDQGAELIDILNFVQKNGIDASGRGKGIQWVEVDATRPDEIAKAIDIFGGLYTGAQISPDWLNGAKEGVVWDIASPGGADDGHCVAWFDYNAEGVILNSWGFFVTLTWAAAAKYWGKSAGGEVYAVFSPDWLDAKTQQSPSGFNAAQLAADLKALG